MQDKDISEINAEFNRVYDTINSLSGAFDRYQLSQVLTTSQLYLMYVKQETFLKVLKKHGLLESDEFIQLFKETELELKGMLLEHAKQYEAEQETESQNQKKQVVPVFIKMNPIES